MTVGIIIPAYNGEKVISRALDSVLSQTYSNWELIIVDDGSTDRTREIVEGYVKKDKRITYVYQENSGGPARPFNAGIRSLKTEYVALLEQDDEWLPEKLERQKWILESRNDISSVGSEAYISYPNYPRHLMKIGHQVTSDEWLRTVLEGKGFFYNLSTLMFRNKGFSFDERLSVSADFDFYITLAREGFLVIHEPLSVYYSSFESLSKGEQSLGKLIDDEVLLFDKYAKLYERFPYAYAKRLGFVAVSLYCAGKQREARQYVLRSLRTYPLQPMLCFKVLILSLFGVKRYISVRNWYFKHVKRR